MDETLISTLAQILRQPLPGFEAQEQMMSRRFKHLDPKMYRQPPADARQAAVMLLLFEKEQRWHTTLMQRPESQYAHSRQVSFPGGSLEPDDPDLEACAKRETEEEFGIPRSSIQVIGALSQLYIPASGFLVQPYVGHLNQAPTYQPNASEVEEVLEVPLAHLLDQQRRKLTEITVSSGMVLKDIPYYDLHNKVVWGATAMMLSEFVYLLERHYGG